MTTWTGVYSGAQAAQGEAIYLERCAGCHQPDLSGGEDAPPLAGAQFGAKWNDRTLGDLFERMRRSMPLDEPGSLTTTEYAQLIAHVLRRNGFPEGASALSERPAALNDIRFVTQRPGG
jgi:quinoprotein glucose dehydrogenase